jgi:hypothetical protein
MKIIIEDFQNAAFMYEGKKYVVIAAKINGTKAIVKTDKRTFVFLESEFNAFYDAIVFVPVIDVKKELNPMQAQPYVEITSKSTSLHAEVVQANQLSVRLTNSLEEIFNELAYGDPTDKTYRKAEAMVRATNAIVSVQLANYKYLSLNK